MAILISPLLVECLGLFNALIAREDLIAHDAEVPITLWTDELGRLRVWAANIGAHPTGQQSLDYRLRDASHIKDQIVRLLERLRRSVVDLREVLSDTLEEAEDQDSDDEDTTKVEQIYNGLVEVITSLFQMSMLIRRPAHRDRLLGTSKEDSVIFEPYDQKHMRDKHPRADDFLVHRLGTAISSRRADLKYRERHHAKLSQGINQTHTSGHNEAHGIHDRESTVFSETIATEYREPNVQFDETGSNSGISQTSYAPTLLEGGNKITVPAPPKESANEQPFECPYCFFITTIKNKRSWASHVFRDIVPYICTFPGCSTPNRLYASRRGWYQHLTNSHISPSSAGELCECPLCPEASFSTLSFEKHLGRYLEELALFALTRTGGDDEVDSDRSRDSPGRGISSHGALSERSSEEAEVSVGGCEPVDTVSHRSSRSFTVATEIPDAPSIISAGEMTDYEVETRDPASRTMYSYAGQNDRDNSSPREYTGDPRDTRWPPINLQPGTREDPSLPPRGYMDDLRDRPRPPIDLESGRREELSSRYQEYFLPGKDINREVIQ